MLQRLAHDRIVELRPNKGAVVASPTPEETRQIFEARRALEAAIMRLAVHNATAADLVIDNTEEMLQQSRAQPLVMGLALHPYIVGQPYRLRHLRRALQRLAQARDSGEVWFCTPGAIAAHMDTLAAERPGAF